MTDGAPGLFDGSPAAPAVQPSSPSPAPVNPIVEASWTPQERRAHQMQDPGQPAAAVSKIQVGDAEFTATELQDAVAAKALETSRKLTLPPDPSGYKIELPADFKAPEGVTFEFIADDPLLAQAQQLAHAKGIDQETFSQMLGLYAGAQVQDQSVITAAKTAEIGKLGVNGPARVDAVTTWLKSVGGADADILIKVLDYAPVAATVVAFENMMRKFAGGGGFTQQHREAPSTKPADEEYNSWSYADQREYSSSGKRPG